MMPHVGAETLARFRQGDLSPRKRSRITAHLARCGRCSDRSSALAGVTTLLASAAPPPMPEHLAARIATALATEAAARRVATPAENGATSPVPAGSTRPGAEPRARHQRSPGPGWRAPRPRLNPRVALVTLASAAGVALVAGGGYALLGQSGGSGPSSAAASGSQDHRPAAAAPLAPGRSTVGPSLPYQYAGQQYLVTAVASGTDYSAGGLRGQVATELSRSGQAGVRAGPNAMTPGVSSSPAAGSATFGNVTVRMLSGCVGRIAAGERVLLVDVARYQGVAATIIVTEGSAGGPEQIWAVGPGCSRSRSDVLEHTSATPAG